MRSVLASAGMTPASTLLALLLPRADSEAFSAQHWPDCHVAPPPLQAITWANTPAPDLQCRILPGPAIQLPRDSATLADGHPTPALAGRVHAHAHVQAARSSELTRMFDQLVDRMRAVGAPASLPPRTAGRQAHTSWTGLRCRCAAISAGASSTVHACGAGQSSWGANRGFAQGLFRLVLPFKLLLPFRTSRRLGPNSLDHCALGTLPACRPGMLVRLLPRRVHWSRRRCCWRCAESCMPPTPPPLPSRCTSRR